MSIDEWFCKLELAENRRMRIRQKLLEHVAAALLLPVELHPASPQPQHTIKEPAVWRPATSKTSAPEDGAQSVSAPASATTERGPAWLEPATPCTTASMYPHSPAERLAEPISVPQVFRPLPASAALSSHPIITNTVTITLDSSSPMPSPLPATWLSPTHEIIKCYQRDRDSYSSAVGRPSAESVRIYAGEEVYKLLADVKEEIERMSFMPERKNKSGESDAPVGEEKVETAIEVEMEVLKPVRFVSMKRPSPLKGGNGRYRS